jgi:hypothetical protein
VNIFAATPTDIVEEHRPAVRRSFGFLCAGIGIFVLTSLRQTELGIFLAAMAIIALAVYPSYLWSRGKAVGLPLVPIACLGDVLWFALPIMTSRGIMELYTPAQVTKAALTEIIFLGTMIATWRVLDSRPASPPKAPYVIAPLMKGADYRGPLWLILFAAATAHQVANVAGWLTGFYMSLPAGTFSLMRAITITATTLSAFVLGMQVSRPGAVGFRIAFWSLFWLQFLALSTSLILASTLTMVLATWAGRLLGSGRIPWISLVAILLAFQVLHAGKSEMRDRYWSLETNQIIGITPADYPGFFTEWASLGIDSFMRQDSSGSDTSLLTRASLVQMLLYAQERAPESVPYLNGATISIIPKLLVPRVLWPDKPRTHEGQVMLNVHFGRQDLESAQRTYINWGMLAEAYANFGMAGPALLGAALGTLLTLVTRASAHAPVASLRFLLSAILMTGCATATVSALATWTVAMFQATVAVTLLSYPLLRRHVPAAPEPRAAAA